MKNLIPQGKDGCHFFIHTKFRQHDHKHINYSQKIMGYLRDKESRHRHEYEFFELTLLPPPTSIFLWRERNVFANPLALKPCPIPLISSRGHCGSSAVQNFYLFLLVFFFFLSPPFGIPVRRGERHSVMVIIFRKVKGNVKMTASFFSFQITKNPLQSIWTFPSTSRNVTIRNISILHRWPEFNLLAWSIIPLPFSLPLRRHCTCVCHGVTEAGYPFPLANLCPFFISFFLFPEGGFPAVQFMNNEVSKLINDTRDMQT